MPGSQVVRRMLATGRFLQAHRLASVSAPAHIPHRSNLGLAFVYFYVLSVASSSAAAASRLSVCACRVGSCSVGIRTRVCGRRGSLDCWFGSALLSEPVFASFANSISTMAGVNSPFRFVDLQDAILIAPSTLCQFPTTAAIAWCRQHNPLNVVNDFVTYLRFHHST